ncbi:hypothetical protein JKP88DRAFT_268029 [Tribonema minus]|uniref:Uncharacterized protein n=1 Tax=Tribonema minus TaxID=303371 RepID=A0A836CIG2_9STRA|nr:hypothetical protein JKP88DRAFT_268029 [Tribonema minus]
MQHHHRHTDASREASKISHDYSDSDDSSSDGSGGFVIEFDHDLFTKERAQLRASCSASGTAGRIQEKRHQNSTDFLPSWMAEEVDNEEVSKRQQVTEAVECPCTTAGGTVGTVAESNVLFIQVPAGPRSSTDYKETLPKRLSAPQTNSGTAAVHSADALLGTSLTCPSTATQEPSSPSAACAEHSHISRSVSCSGVASPATLATASAAAATPVTPAFSAALSLGPERTHPALPQSATGVSAAVQQRPGPPPPTVAPPPHTRLFVSLQPHIAQVESSPKQRSKAAAGPTTAAAAPTSAGRGNNCQDRGASPPPSPAAADRGAQSLSFLAATAVHTQRMKDAQERRRRLEAAPPSLPPDAAAPKVFRSTGSPYAVARIQERRHVVQHDQAAEPLQSWGTQAPVPVHAATSSASASVEVATIVDSTLEDLQASVMAMQRASAGGRVSGGGGACGGGGSGSGGGGGARPSHDVSARGDDVLEAAAEAAVRAQRKVSASVLAEQWEKEFGGHVRASEGGRALRAGADDNGLTCGHALPACCSSSFKRHTLAPGILQESNHLSSPLPRLAEAAALAVGNADKVTPDDWRQQRQPRFCLHT